MRNSRGRKGSAAIEFALSAILMITLCAGVFQFGYTLYVYNQLSASVRAAARYASVAPYTSTSSTPAAAYTNAVKNVAVYGSPTVSTGTPTVPGLTTAHVELVVTMNGGVARQVTIRIVNYTVNAVFGSITFTGKPVMAFAYNG